MDVNTNMFVLKALVQQKFNELRAALHMREKLLLRQLEVIGNSQQLTGRGVPLSPTVEPSGDIKFIGEQESELLAAIRSFGRFQLDNINLALQDVYLKNEDYIEPADDHETMYKCLQEDDLEYELVDGEDNQPEAIVVDFSRNKSLVEDNAKLMNKSIINITLQEAKDLIRKAKIKRETHVPPLNLEELDDELESSIAEAVTSLGRGQSSKTSSHTCVEQQQAKTKQKKPRFKPKITINNCNGTINLRNIASLTINCANEEAVSAEIPLTKIQSADSSTATEHSTPTTTASSSNYSSNASSRTHSKKLQKGAGGVSKRNKTADKLPKPAALASTSTTSNTSERYCAAEPDEPASSNDDTHNVTCDFYNRLLNEIKKSLKEKPKRYYDNSHVQAAAADSTCDANLNPEAASCTSQSTSNANTATTSTSQIQPGKRLILKNFENLKIILEANSGDEDAFHPVQIEQWLAEIISETDLEPMQNTDILEHSKITTESN